MIRDVTCKIKFTVHNQPDEIDITVTGQQLEDTMRRRMKSLMPTARITDIAELIPDSAQLDLTTKKTNATR